MMLNILQCFLSFCRFPGRLQAVSQCLQSFLVCTSGLKNPMCMLFGLSGGKIMMWRSLGMAILPRNKKGWTPDKETVFIFDEAQMSYKDTELWMDLFKCIHAYRERRAIVFVRYGSPSSFIDIEGIPFSVAPRARVSLLPTVHEDNLPSAGLLFTCAEFDGLVLQQYPCSEYPFHSSFLDEVFAITEGRVGAICSFLSIILGSDVCTFFLTRS